MMMLKTVLIDAEAKAKEEARQKRIVYLKAKIAALSALEDVINVAYNNLNNIYARIVWGPIKKPSYRTYYAVAVIDSKGVHFNVSKIARDGSIRVRAASIDEARRDVAQRYDLNSSRLSACDKCRAA